MFNPRWALRSRILLSLALVTSLYAATAPPTAARHVEESSTGAWTASYGPNGGRDGLIAITALSANDIWAVGARSNRPLADHWDGHRWTSASVPAPGEAGVSSQLDAVAGRSGRGVWAVGMWGGCGSQPLIEGWNGRRWSRAAANIPATWPANLDSVTVVSPTDAWAVGGYATRATRCVGGSAGQPPAPRSHSLVEHWNGKRWSQVQVPTDPRGDNELWSVSAVSAHDVWAAGDVTWGTRTEPLVERFDGRRWHIIRLPDQGARERDVTQIQAVSADNVWLVGNYWPNRAGPHTVWRTLIDHWNGSRWTITPSPSSSCDSNLLFSIDMLGMHDGWSVGGGNSCGHIGNKWTGLIEHWNGRTWTLVRFPANGVELTSLTFAGPQRGWAVGNWIALEGKGHSLIERYLGNR